MLSRQVDVIGKTIANQANPNILFTTDCDAERFCGAIQNFPESIWREGLEFTRKYVAVSGEMRPDEVFQRRTDPTKK